MPRVRLVLVEHPQRIRDRQSVPELRAIRRRHERDPCHTDDARGRGTHRKFAGFHAEALGNPYERRHVGTYELIGPKLNGNPEGEPEHVLIRHDDAHWLPTAPRDYDGLRVWLLGHVYEGIVWHHPDGRMAKLKRRDFA